MALAAAAGPQHDGDGDACHRLYWPSVGHDLRHKAAQGGRVLRQGCHRPSYVGGVHCVTLTCTAFAIAFNSLLL